jgi:hypothetical protein
MKEVQKLCLSLAVLVGVTGFAMLTSRASADVIIQIGPQPVPNPVVYHYVYYPEEEVYFVPETRVYWWSVGGEWRSGPRVPEGITLGVNVKLDVDGRDPWQHHTVIRGKFPGHKHDQQDKHDSEHDHGDNDHGGHDHK